MRKIRAQFRDTHYRAGDYPDKPIGQIIREPIHVISPSGETLLLYDRLPPKAYQIVNELVKQTKPTKSTRTENIPQLSTVYGYLPRIAIREDYCRVSKKSREEAANYRRAVELGQVIAEYYRDKLPYEYNSAIEKVRAQIDPSYREEIGADTPWLNCNVNVNQVIKYHRDAGNVSADLSNVIIVKRNVEGGYLSVPELGISLGQDDGFMVLFRGQDLLHGVTPCKFIGADAMRASIVFYTLENMRHCYPYETELKRLNHVKTIQSSNRLGKMSELKKLLEQRRKRLEKQ